MGFEPTLSGSRNRRISWLSYVLKSPPPKSTQRESNPHILHGEQGGCRYITGAKTVGPEGLEPSPRWLRARHAAANTWIPRHTVQTVGREALESSSAVLQTAANPSQLPAQKKKAGHPVAPGLTKGTCPMATDVKSARDIRGAGQNGRRRWASSYSSSWPFEDSSPPLGLCISSFQVPCITCRAQG